MNTIRSLYLWTVGSLFFILIAFVFAVLLLIIKPVRLYPYIRIAFRTISTLMGIKITVHGRDHIDNDRSYLFMGNHESLFDIFVIPVAIPTHFVGIEAAYHFSIPIWGFLVKRWGCIPVHRRDKEQAIKDLERAKQVLLSGTSVAVLPEGHRTMTGQVGEFKKGPFHLALATQATILPLAIKGLYDYKSKHTWHLRPTQVQVTFGKPIPFEEYEYQTVDQLSKHIRDVIISLKG